MKQEANKAYAPFWTSDKRYIIAMGGRGAGRSHTASQFNLSKLMGDDYFRCAIMRYIQGDIRDSIFQDIVDRAEEQGIKESIDIKRHTLSFRYGENLIKAMGFRTSSGSHKAKLKSLANYNTVVIEEANEVSEDMFMQLDDSIRTKKGSIRIILLLNPPSKNHWIIKRWFNLVDSEVDGFYIPKLKDSVKDNTEFIHTTYKDNIVNLSENTITNYERYKETNKEHYYNMIRGLVSEGAIGRIYENWKPMPDDEFMKLPFPEYYGLDFGFSNSPTALVECKDHNQDVYFNELLYETGLTNKMISDRMEALGVSKSAIIYADSAEPKSIEELQRLGWNVKPASKGKDSVTAGIDKLKEKNVYYTESSENLSEEYQEYTWALDRQKNPTNKPKDKENHLMDAGRYAIYTRLSKRPGDPEIAWV